MPKFIDCEQNTAEWFKEGCGRITASRICDVMRYLKNGKESADRRNYRTEIMAERLTGLQQPHFVSDAMKWGSEMQDFAEQEYSKLRDVLVYPVGFAIHPTMDFSGASPDGLIDADGGLEIKCPNTATHIEWMESGVVPEEHQEQMLWNMVCCERQWWDFVSFDPRLPEGVQIFVKRLEYDEERIAKIEAEVLKFNGEVNAAIERLNSHALVSK